MAKVLTVFKPDFLVAVATRQSRAAHTRVYCQLEEVWMLRYLAVLVHAELGLGFAGPLAHGGGFALHAFHQHAMKNHCGGDGQFA